MLCEALTHFKSENEINVPIFLKLTSDMELEGFKTFYRQLRKRLTVLSCQYNAST